MENYERELPEEHIARWPEPILAVWEAHGGDLELLFIGHYLEEINGERYLVAEGQVTGVPLSQVPAIAQKNEATNPKTKLRETQGSISWLDIGISVLKFAITKK